MTQRMKAEFKADGSGVEIEFLPASGATGILNLTPEALLLLVQQLGKMHAQLVSGKAIPTLEGAQIEAVFNTRWFVQPEMIGEASVLSFQHPSFGPVGFAIPMDQVASLVHLLTTQLDLAKSIRSSPQ